MRETFPLGFPSSSSVLQSRPFSYLKLAIQFIYNEDYTSLSQVIRHPDVQIRLREQVPGVCAISVCDRYFEKHLARSIKANSIDNKDGEFWNILNTLQALLLPLKSYKAKGNSVPEAFIELLLSLYENSTEISIGENEREAFLLIRDVLEKIHIFQDSYTLHPLTLIELLSAELQGAEISESITTESVEVLGWLELSLDEAQSLIICGFTENIVPQSVLGDPLLTNSLREQLGLLDNARREARDIYALLSLINSKKYLKILFPCSTTEGEVVFPSKLLFIDKEEKLAKRVQKLLIGKEVKRDIENDIELLSFYEPEKLDSAPKSVSVSGLSDYINCPYRYYLRHILRLESVETKKREMSAADFGQIAHSVLATFCKSEQRSSKEKEDIFSALSSELDKECKTRFGRESLPAILLQVEQLRARFEAFSYWQAAWRRSGWEILESELEFPKGEILLGNDSPISLIGRIDRIDKNQKTGEIIIFDYKTPETPSSPERAHLNSEGEWVNLQLPAYKYMYEKKFSIPVSSLGYIYLPSELSQTGESLANWEDSDFKSAQRKIEEVGKLIQNQVFWPPRQDYKAYDNYQCIVEACR